MRYAGTWDVVYEVWGFFFLFIFFLEGVFWGLVEEEEKGKKGKREKRKKGKRKKEK